MVISRKRREEPGIITKEQMDAIEDAAIAGKPLKELPEAEQGPALLAAAAAEPTLDIYLDRSPKVGKPIDYPAMVAILQRKRQMFITAEQKRKAGDKEEPIDE